MFHSMPIVRKRRSVGGILVLLMFLLMIAAIGGIALAWWLYMPPEQATVYLRVQPLSGESEQQYAVQQATQIALFKSHFVLNAALARSEIAQLDCVLQQEAPVKWLSNELEVSFPGDGEIMEVVLRGQESDMADYCRLLDAVTESYFNEVVHKLRIRASEFQERKEKVLSELAKEIKVKLDRYETLRSELQPEEDEYVPLLVLLEDEIEVMRKIWKQKQTELRLSRLDQEVETVRMRLLQRATSSSE